MKTAPLNIDYWASLYTVYTDYAEQYDEALKSDAVVERAERLWEWKGLNRAKSFENVAATIDGIDWDEYIEKSSKKAIDSLTGYLIENDVIGSSSIVTPAFLLHLAASGPDNYSVKFPIYDRRVWNAYVYLWGVRDPGESLYHAASHSSEQYSAFCREFRRICPEGKERDFERALFMFGGLIMDLPPEDAPTPIENIEQFLADQEHAISRMYDNSDHALVNGDFNG